MMRILSARIIPAPWLSFACLALACCPPQARAANDPTASLARIRDDRGLADYAAFLSASIHVQQKNYAALDADLARIWSFQPPSPVIAQAAALAAPAYLDAGQPAKARDVLLAYGADMPVPTRELLLARAEEALGNKAAAAQHYRRIWLEFPYAKEAADAALAIGKYGLPPARDQLARCWRLLGGAQPARARIELQQLLPQLSGADLDLARVRIGVSNYLARDYKAAFEYLRQLTTTTPEAGAERLYYLAQSALHLDRTEALETSLADLAREYPQSGWRVRAMVAAADYYQVSNDSAHSDPLFHACYTVFPKEPQAAYCQWRYTWSQYLKTYTAAQPLLVEHLQTFPGSSHVPAALYFLARIAQGQNQPGSARRYYEVLVRDFPTNYYGTLARDRLRSVAASPTPATAPPGLATLPPPKSAALDLKPSLATRYRTARSQRLTAAGLDDLAVMELRYAADHDPQPGAAAIALSQLALKRNRPSQALNYIKRYVPDYLTLPVTEQFSALWRLAFPMPYRRALDTYSNQRGLDSFRVAGLIRQESAFDPAVVSRANAYGLTQLLPSTARAISRRLKMRRFHNEMLFRPEINIQIGTYHLRSMLDSLGGNWEAALASYNAGRSRAVKWLSWRTYREPAEFVETIPFYETRDYVKAVVRNAAVYRVLYAPGALRLN